MTINLMLVTSDALILGCDSTASKGTYYVDPFSIGLEKNAQGQVAEDAEGRVSVKFKFDQIEHVITDAWGGVTKMFSLSGNYCHVAAVTSGTAALNQRPISSLASEFRERLNKQKAAERTRTVKGIAEDFLQSMRAEYDEHYKDSPLPVAMRDGPEFLVGGFGHGDKFPSSYRVRVKENDVREDFVKGECGLSWNAQSDAVERIIRGYDRKLRFDIETAFDEAIKSYQREMNQAVLRILDNLLKKLNVAMPEGVDTTLPSTVTVSPPWDKLKARIPYSALPLQEAVNFVAYLIMMQAGKSRFAPGVATVGGRTHIGVITKDEGYRQVNEPEITHHYTGFADDH
jgi:hypothetical protein